MEPEMQIIHQGSRSCPSAFVEMMESSIGIGLQNIEEEAEMLLGMFSLAILRIDEPHSWWHVTACRSIVAHIGPESPGLGVACAWCQHRIGLVIGVYLRSRKHVLTQLIDQTRI